MGAIPIPATMNEAAMRRKVIKALRVLDAIPVENAVCPGTPDINYAGGWIELKCLQKWPSRGGIVRIPHLTAQQRLWLRKRWRASSGAWLLLRVGRSWLLFDGETAAGEIGHCNEHDTMQLACAMWTKFPGDLLVHELV